MIIARNTFALALLGLTGVLGGLLAGFGCYSVGQDIAVEQLFRSNLLLARTLGLPDGDGELDHERLLAAWQRLGQEEDGSYLCVIDRDGALVLNTKRPEKVGQNVGGVMIPEFDDPSSVGELARNGGDWVGINTNYSGMEQLAAYAYSAPLDSIVAVHLPAHVFRSEVRGRVLPWALAGGLCGLLLLPGAFAFLFAALRAARKQVDRQSAQLAELRERVLLLQRYESFELLTRGVTHDLRGVLQGIQGAAEFALGELEKQGGNGELLHSIETSVEHADELLERLRGANRAAPGEPASTDLAAVARDALLILRPCTPRAVDLEAHVEDDLPPVALEQVRVQQVLMNLGLNALHAMREFGGRLSITAERAEDEHVLLTVSDTGHGMDDVTLGQIFEPEFTTRSNQGGSGLGLAVVEEIVRTAGGSINVTSVPAVGTTFEIYLPCSSAVRAQTLRSARAASRN